MHEYLGLDRGRPMFRQDFTCPALLKDLSQIYVYGTITLFGSTFQSILLFKNLSHWPGPLSLATTNGVSFDVLSYRYLDVSVPCVCFLHPIYSGEDTFLLITKNLNCFFQNSLMFFAIKGGLPHSEIYGSKGIRTSP